MLEALAGEQIKIINSNNGDVLLLMLRVGLASEIDFFTKKFFQLICF